MATEYGESLLPEGSNITTTHERMDENQMIEFINEYHPSYVVDATHPYAIEVTENLQNACEKAVFLLLFLHILKFYFLSYRFPLGVTILSLIIFVIFSLYKR